MSSNRIFFPKKKPNFLQRITRAMVILCVIGIIAGGYSYYKLHAWGLEKRTLSSPVVIDFEPGTRMVSLSGDLESKGVIDKALYFGLWVKAFSNYSKFLAGKYRFEGDVSPSQIADKIVSGKTFNPIVIQYVIPEGFSLKKTIKRLISNGIGNETDFKKLLIDKEFISSLEVPTDNLEGYIYPATYSFTKKITPRQAIKEAVDTFWEHLPSDYEEQVTKRNLTLQEAVTFASLIELETQQESEKPLVSEVIWRRLKNRAPLAVDAALIYGIKDYQGDIRWKHLKDKKNPYNTRVHRGLPPSPIGSPSLSSLRAVLEPSDKGYYYYVLDPKDRTRHHFSKTLAEHNRHVKKLVKASRGKKSTPKSRKKARQ